MTKRLTQIPKCDTKKGNTLSIKSKVQIDSINVLQKHSSHSTWLNSTPWSIKMNGCLSYRTCVT